jgi:hypothetical protein
LEKMLLAWERTVVTLMTRRSAIWGLFNPSTLLYPKPVLWGNVLFLKGSSGGCKPGLHTRRDGSIILSANLA